MARPGKPIGTRRDQCYKKAIAEKYTIAENHLDIRVLLVEHEVQAIREREVSHVLVGLPLTLVALGDLVRQLGETGGTMTLVLHTSFEF